MSIEIKNKILQGDCLDIMEKIESKSIDLILTDPPFFMPAAHYQSKIKWQRQYADLTPLKVFWQVIIQHIKRILKETGHLFVFCNCDSYPVFYEPTYNAFDKTKSLIWDKTRIGLGHIYRHQHELIIWARYKNSKYNNNGKARSDILSFPATKSKDRIHPVEKPVRLLEYLIEPTTYENDLVLDPFAGSGTTLIASQNLKRNFIGIELSQVYAEQIEKRFKEEMELFV